MHIELLKTSAFAKNLLTKFKLHDILLLLLSYLLFQYESCLLKFAL